jgi:tetratricopeptide (TPR) repeat protein
VLLLRSLPALLLLLSGCASAPPVPAAAAPDRGEAAKAVERLLDDWHAAAARADEAAYFAAFAPEGVFLGTDATERWDVTAFRAYAHPRFATGKAWSFHATRRAVAVSADGQLAWFDEDLATERLGPARGSGVVASVGGAWKIAQYNLTTVVPNDRFDAVRAAIDKPPAPAAPRFDEDPEYKASSGRALTAAKEGRFEEAERELRELVRVAERAEDGALEALGLHEQLAWLRWSDRDLPGAYAEIELALGALDRSRMIGNASVATYVDILFDRALVLRELAAQAPPALRAAALARAEATRAEHADRAGGAVVDPGDAVVVSVFFAVQARDAKAALALAWPWSKGFPESNPAVHLYVMARAFELGGDHARAAEARSLLAKAPDAILTFCVRRRLVSEANGASTSAPLGKAKPKH